MGIEPTLSAWEAEVLPLNYTRARFECSWPVDRVNLGSGLLNLQPSAPESARPPSAHSGRFLAP